jgi:hypothetical protein
MFWQVGAFSPDVVLSNPVTSDLKVRPTVSVDLQVGDDTACGR